MNRKLLIFLIGLFSVSLCAQKASAQGVQWPVYVLPGVPGQIPMYSQSHAGIPVLGPSNLKDTGNGLTYKGVPVGGGGSGTSITLSTSGTNGAATLNAGALNIPVYQGQITLTTTGSNCAVATFSGTSLNIPACAPTGGGSAFSAITGGTNTSAAMILGSGASLSATGTGSITATAMPWSGLTGSVPTFNQSTTGNAATSTAFATSPTLCTAGAVPTGILANGNATGCFTPAGSGFANPMTAQYDLILGGSGGSPTRFAGNTANNAGVLTSTGNGTTTVSEAWNNAPALSAANMLSFPTLNQSTTGNAATASALASAPTLCSTGNAPTGILANGNATGCATIGGGGSSAFSALTSGTNTTAAMVVGTGGSISTSGSGTIAATSAVTATSATSATTATNVAGGSIGVLPYQSAAGTTAFLAANTAATDQVLVSHGTGSAGLAPTLSNAPALSAANMTAFPTLNQNTTGSAATATTATSASTATNISGGTVGVIDYQSGVGTTAFLAANTAATDQALISHGTGSVGLAPTLSNAPALSAANMTSFPTLNQNTTGNAATATTATNSTNATNATNATTSTNVAGGVLGSLPYQSAAATTALLAPNTSTTLEVLTQTGTGSVGAAPVWLATIGTGNLVRATSPTLVTPVLGAATMTSYVVTGGGGMLASGISQGTIGTAIAAATTIAPVSPIVHITGTTAINTITPPTGCTTGGTGCTITLIADGTWTMGTSGNISVAVSAMTVGNSLDLYYDPTASKWYPNPNGGTGGSSAWSAITAGTNTAALVMGTGGSLTVSGTGTINSTTLLGSTWAIPGAIGGTTPAAGAFTTLSSTGALSIGSSPPTACGTATGCIGFTDAATAGTPTSGQGYIRFDSTSGKILYSINASAEANLAPSNIITGTFTQYNWYYAGSSGLALAEANASTTVPAVCFAVTTTVCQTSGLYNYTPGGLTVGATFYLSDTTAGASTTTAPTTSTHYIQKLAISIDASHFIINPSYDVGYVQ